MPDLPVAVPDHADALVRLLGGPNYFTAEQRRESLAALDALLVGLRQAEERYEFLKGEYVARRTALIDERERNERLTVELETANFFRDPLADRLRLVETAAVELEGARACAESVDPDHWRDHTRHAMESALNLCKQAIKQAVSYSREAK
jgi:hypothetical protein